MLDIQTLFSNNQAITATAVSTNVVDLGEDRNLGVGEPVALRIRVTETFTLLTSLAIAVQTANNEAFDDGLETLVSTSMLAAELVAGATTPFICLPRGVKRFVRLNYTVTGTNPNAGEITAGLAANEHDWKVYPGVIGGAG